MRPITKITAIIILVLGLLNLARVLLDIHVEIFSVGKWVGYKKIPHWISIAAFIISIPMSVGLWRESKKV